MKPIKILRLSEVKLRTGLSTSSIYGLISKGQFPKQIMLTTHSVGWCEDELQDWLLAQLEKRNAS